jgi:hypothetical protein
MSVQDIGSIFDLLYIKRRRVDLEFCIVVLAGSSINIRYSSCQSVSLCVTPSRSRLNRCVERLLVAETGACTEFTVFIANLYFLGGTHSSINSQHFTYSPIL